MNAESREEGSLRPTAANYSRDWLRKVALPDHAFVAQTGTQLQAVDDLISRITTVGTVFNSIGMAMTVENIVSGTFQNTWNKALEDIAYWDMGGIHYPHSQGSMLNWNALQIDWGEYGIDAEGGLNDPAAYVNALMAFIMEGLNAY